ncbi:MAG: ParB/RepB/Spo0J family partition protein [Oscillospiraceae bacterium]|nr:ParB/RepB/Spo0J family partition protein [Oscillospiraceae bacterium]
MAKRGGLGKGLDALLPSVSARKEGGVMELGVGQIARNAWQPRKSFDDGALGELRDSILEHGVVQPIIVRKVARGYEIVAGERRWRAAKLAGLATVPAIVREATHTQAMELALVENLQREDLNPMEEARAYETLAKDHGQTQEQIAKAVGRSRPAVANALRLLDLPPEAQGMLAAGAISPGHGRAILALPDAGAQAALARRAAEGGLSVRECEALAKAALTAVGGQGGKARGKAGPGGDGEGEDEEALARTEIGSLEERLTRCMSTKVRIDAGKGKGRIVIDYYSDEEFDRIFGMLVSRGGDA